MIILSLESERYTVPDIDTGTILGTFMYHPYPKKKNIALNILLINVFHLYINKLGQ